jgi:hypothetical protein
MCHWPLGSIKVKVGDKKDFFYVRLQSFTWEAKEAADSKGSDSPPPLKVVAWFTVSCAYSWAFSVDSKKSSKSDIAGGGRKGEE